MEALTGEHSVPKGSNEFDAREGRRVAGREDAEGAGRRVGGVAGGSKGEATEEDEVAIGG